MQFICRYGTEEGKVETRIITADTQDAALIQVKKENIIIYDLKPRRLLSFLSPGKKAKINRQEFLIFVRELIALLRAGLPLTQSIEILNRRRKDKHFYAILASIRDSIKSGSSLADSFRQHREFSPLFTSLVETGEKSGELPLVLDRYLIYAEKFDEMKRKLISALIYPAILIMLSIILIFVMLSYVIPKFVGFYENSEKDLPMITRALMATSSFVSSNILYIIAVLILLYIGYQYFKSTRKGELAIDKMKFRLPLVGPVWHKYSINQFCRSLEVMLHSGLPLISSLSVSMKTMTNKYMVEKTKSIIDEVNEGETLYASLERTGMFTDIAIEMIQVGEQTGSLDDMLVELSDFYDRDIDLVIDRLMRVLEPIFLILMGIIIAGMLLAMYLPIFKAGAIIGGT
ncbi:MAG: type II secretion system F family protein [Acidobacteria bacterium]|nr:type II secretion system F family protein [Acidobacteriota bacterium]